MGLLDLKWTSGSMVLGRGDTCYNLSSRSSSSGHHLHQFLHKGKAEARWRRGRGVIVATGPATEAPFTATNPLTKHDLIDYFLCGCKPKDKWRSPTFYPSLLVMPFLRTPHFLGTKLVKN